MQDLLKKYQDHVVDETTQKSLNAPLKDDTGFNEGHEEFLTVLMKKIETRELDPHQPKSLYNRAIYEKLTEGQQEKADLTAINLMSLIRQIESLWNIEKTATFQIQNLVETVFQMKAKFEAEYGDVYII